MKENKEKLIDALEGLDDDLILQNAPGASNTSNKRKRTAVKFLIAAAAAAAVAVLVTVLALTVFNKKEPERQTPVLPAASETESGGETEKQTAEPTGKTEKTTGTEIKTTENPTETAEPTPTPTETAEPTPTPTETAEPTDYTPGWLVSGYGNQPDYILILDQFQPEMVIRVNGISEETIYRQIAGVYGNSQIAYRRVDCDVLYAQGVYYDYGYGYGLRLDDSGRIIPQMEGIEGILLDHLSTLKTPFGETPVCFLKDLIGDGTEIYLSEERLSSLGVGVGDTLYCNAKILVNGDRIELLSYSCVSFVDGLFVKSDDYNEYGDYHGPLCNYFAFLNGFRRAKEEGYPFVHKDLFDRLPSVDPDKGLTVEEFIEVCDWFIDLMKTIECTDASKMGWSYIL